MEEATIHLGFEVGTGNPVVVPLAHTFVTGQTQLSGKTTTLRAIVERAGRPAIAFVTKRGERFEGQRIPPYLPREGTEQIPWRLVETIMAAALGQRNMKWERGAIVTAAKGATTLEEVRQNVRKLRDKARGKNEELYMLLGEYLDLVLPEMRSLNASHELTLRPGLNVMDLSGTGPQTQAMVIRAVLEHINRHEAGVLTVFPEAWEFAPRGRGAPAKDEAIAMARKGAAIGNFLLSDSQDIAGVDTVIRQAASVWILGVQRELNELKRTIQMIPAGIKRPKPEEVSTLELGQFIACWGKHTVKTYVQPIWLSDEEARAVALGGPLPKPPAPQVIAGDENSNSKLDEILETLRSQGNQIDSLERRITVIEKRPTETIVLPGANIPLPTTNKDQEYDMADFEEFYQRTLERLKREAPALVATLAVEPELIVTVEKKRYEYDAKTAIGGFAKLIAEGFFDDNRSPNSAFEELKRRGYSLAKPSAYDFAKKFATMGFLTIERDGYKAVPNLKRSIIEK